MSGERDDNLSGEGHKNNQTLEQRLKALEAERDQFASKAERLEKESKKYKEQARGLEEVKTKEAEEKKRIEDERLLEQGQYKQLLEQREERLRQLESEKEEESKKAQKAEKTLVDARKLSAFQRRLGGQLKHDDYLAFIDTDKIAINPENGNVDGSSLDGVVKDFLSKHEALVDFGARRLPNGQGGSGKGGISKNQWQKGSNKDKIDNFEEAFKTSQK